MRWKRMAVLYARGTLLPRDCRLRLAVLTLLQWCACTTYDGMLVDSSEESRMLHPGRALTRIVRRRRKGSRCPTVVAWIQTLKLVSGSVAEGWDKDMGPASYTQQPCREWHQRVETVDINRDVSCRVNQGYTTFSSHVCYRCRRGPPRDNPAGQPAAQGSKR